METLADTNWSYLLSLLPKNWENLARASGGLRRLRGTNSAGDLLRTLLLHVGHGFSLRSTTVLAKAAGWAAMSDVALLHKLRTCESWLHKLCLGMLSECGPVLPAVTGPMRWRLVDSTLIKEPGDTGSQWRVLYSLSVPDWQCDFFRLTAARGKGNGESLKHFEVKAGDCLLADRGFSHLAGIDHVVAAGGHVIVRLNEQNTPLESLDGEKLNLWPWLEQCQQPGTMTELKAWTRAPGGANRIPVRLCAIRKSPEAVALAQRKLQRRAQQDGSRLRAVTLEYSAWIIVLTTLEETVLKAGQVLEWYRIRWQIELAFKRLKSLAGAGHVPKKDPVSSRAWLYGKLLMALLSEKMQRHAAALSPWGANWLERDTPTESLA